MTHTTVSKESQTDPGLRNYRPCPLRRRRLKEETRARAFARRSSRSILCVCVQCWQLALCLQGVPSRLKHISHTLYTRTYRFSQKESREREEDERKFGSISNTHFPTRPCARDGIAVPGTTSGDDDDVREGG